MKSNAFKHRANQRVLAGLMTVALGVTGVTAVSSTAPAFAQDAQCSNATARKSNGKGSIKLVGEKNYRPGDIVEVEGTDFEQRPDKGYLVAKINSNALDWPSDQPQGHLDGTSKTEVYFDKADLPGADGTFTFKLKLPTVDRSNATLKDGTYVITILGGNDGGSTVSQSLTVPILNEGSAPGTCGTLKDEEQPADPSAAPTASETSSAAPTASETSSAEPTASETSSAEPTASETSSAEPTASETSSAEPTASETSSAEPTASKTSSAEPTKPNNSSSTSSSTSKNPGNGNNNDGNLSSNPGPFATFLGVLGIFGALAAGFGHLVNIGVINPDLLPVWLRHVFRI